jgi:hypothetical protein
MNNNELSKVTRVELIDDSGRVYVLRKDGIRVWTSIQDDGKTLKIFIEGGMRGGNGEVKP